MATKVLLVDDSTTRLMMEEMILTQGTNCECVTAKDGLDAISRAVDEAPYLGLMDVFMPRMNGFEACKRMRMKLLSAGYASSWLPRAGVEKVEVPSKRSRFWG